VLAEQEGYALRKKKFRPGIGSLAALTVQFLLVMVENGPASIFWRTD
jgi:hypothetical protein